MTVLAPIVAYGTQKLCGTNAVQLCEEAWRAGIRTFDCALSYGNQQFIAPFFSRVTNRRSFAVVSKIRKQQIEELGVRQAVQLVLEQLRLDYIDVLLVHAPKGVDHVSTLTELQYLRRKGVVRFCGVSNYTQRHLVELERAGVMPQVVQNEIHPFLQENSLVQFCRRRGIAIMSHTSFARGEVFVHRGLVDVAAEEGITVSNLALSWLLARGVSPIFSSLDADHIRSVCARRLVALSVKTWSAIAALDCGMRLCSHPSWAEFDS